MLTSTCLLEMIATAQAAGCDPHHNWLPTPDKRNPTNTYVRYRVRNTGTPVALTWRNSARYCANRAPGVRTDACPLKERQAKENT
jgi:hypothetical protein